MIQRIKDFFAPKKTEINHKYSGLSDFMLNATPEEKIEVMTEAARRANNDQRELMERYNKKFSKV